MNDLESIVGGYGDLSYFVYKRTYARMKEDGSSEEFWETCQRVVDALSDDKQEED